MISQKFRHTVIFSPALIGLMLVAMPAMGEEPKDTPAATPRQVAHCMMKRLRADRTQSYRDAFNTCKRDLTAGPNRDAAPDRDAATAMNAQSGDAAAKPD
jgi:hypothetical protein